ncbi:hypothetical protein Tco_0010273 [Tanacetum coccineum]
MIDVSFLKDSILKNLLKLEIEIAAPVSLDKTHLVLAKDHLQVGDIVWSRKTPSNCKSMAAAEGTVVGLEKDTDRDGFPLVIGFTFEMDWEVGMEIGENVNRDEVEKLVRELMDGIKGKRLRKMYIGVEDKVKNRNSS